MTLLSSCQLWPPSGPMLVFIVSLRTVKSVSRVFHVTGGQFISCDYFVWKFGFILNVTTSSFFGEIVCSI